MSAVKKRDRTPQDVVAASFERNGGNVRATSKELGISRHTVRRIITPLGLMKKPLASGTIDGTKAEKQKLPVKGEVRRYVLTSAQNNTYVHESAWRNLNALAKHYNAEIIVGTYTYNQNRFGKLSVKRGTDKMEEKELWYDPKITDHIQDRRIQLAPGLVWCGEMNILPTAVQPLASLESYTGRNSAIFPHAKLAMRSIATMQGEGVKMNYTTGTITQRNYIQKREGMIAEFHHIYGGLLVEVNSDGNWWVRQLNEDESGTIQDLDVVSKNGKVTTGNRIESITLGDIHATQIDPDVMSISRNIIATLKPKHIFLHDVMEGASVNHHESDNPHARFMTWMRGLTRLDAELEKTVGVLNWFNYDFAKTVIVYSNHDDPWLKSWLQKYDYRKDPANSELFLKAQAYMYSELRKGKMVRDVNMLEWFLKNAGYNARTKFLLSDESYLTCGKKIENGQHGHLGPAGRWGSPLNLATMARKANTAHTHSCGIYGGLYVAGTSTNLRWNYNQGPSNWSHTHIFTYPNGKRALATIYAEKWRA
jgi:hypothetical protein